VTFGYTEMAVNNTTGSKSVDVTALVKSWLGGTQNNGFLIVNYCSGAWTYPGLVMAASDYADNSMRPVLQVEYLGNADICNVQNDSGAVCDTYIYPDAAEAWWGDNTASKGSSTVFEHCQGGWGYASNFLLRFDQLPSFNSDEVLSATLKLYRTDATGVSLSASKVTTAEAFTENTTWDTATANNKRGWTAITSNYTDMSVGNGIGYKSVDVTSIVKAWFDGSPNNGFLITNYCNGSWTYPGLVMATSDYGDGAMRPILQIKHLGNKENYASNDPANVCDTFIMQVNDWYPNGNQGSNSLLQHCAGDWSHACNFLIRFDSLPVVEADDVVMAQFGLYRTDTLDLSSLPSSKVVAAASFDDSVMWDTTNANNRKRWYDFGDMAYNELTITDSTGYKYADVTNIIKSWLSGSTTNNGFLVTNNANGTWSYPGLSMASVDNDNSTYRPVLRIITSPLDRGHRLILQHGLQIQAAVFNNGTLSSSRWQSSNFTAPIFYNTQSPELFDFGTGNWGAWAITSTPTVPEGYDACDVSNLYYKDEQYLGDPAEVQATKNEFDYWRQIYPNALVYTNQRWDRMDEDDVTGYMEYARPDMISYDHYSFVSANYWPGGSPTTLYNFMGKYRRLALAGLDGTGTRPIPYGHWLQSYVYDGYTVSESELRLEQFAGWAYGFTFASAFIYNAEPGGLQSILFSGSGDTTPTATFTQMSTANSMSRKLGPSLVRLISTDVRFIPGKHNPGSVNNAIPSDVLVWSAANLPLSTLFTSVSNITNLGGSTVNNGLAGDVVVGYFKPLDEAFDGPDYSNEVYFMVVNGLTANPTKTAYQTRQRIRLNFASTVTSIQRMRRSDGIVETITTSGSNPRYYQFELDGGTGDLFKINTGAPFIGSSTQ
jgi:hypothetical protein